MSAAGIATVSWFALTQVAVAMGGCPKLPFHSTVDPVMKPFPDTVSVNPVLPATAVEGDMDVTEGAGVLTAKTASAEGPPPGVGFTTLTTSFCPAAISDAPIAVVSWVALM